MNALPTGRQWLFSVKTFAAGMLAVYIAFRLDLTQPTWALLTTYIVSQPLAGAVIAKSAARVAGTLIGATMAVTLVSAFAEAREFFVAALALWVATCLYVSILLREAPASYGAMLAGYSAAIVGYPAVLAPLAAFDIAVARCTEISLGILCATAVSRLVFPQASGGLLRRTLRDSLAAAGAWAGDVLRGKADDAHALPDRRRLLNDLMTIDQLRLHAVLDTPEVRAADGTLRHLQARLFTLVSMLVSIHDRLRLLRREAPARAEALAPTMTELAEAIEAGRGDRALEARLDAALPGLDAMRRDPARRLEHILVARLGDVTRLEGELRALAGAFFRGAPSRDHGAAPHLSRYRDHTQALVGGLVAGLSLVVTATFWIATGWSHGATAAFLVAVLCSMLATLDDPSAAGKVFLIDSVISVVVCAVYNYVIFPSIDGFAMMAASMALFLVPIGCFIADRRFAPLVMPLILNTIAISNLQNVQGVDFAEFLNGAVSLMVGVGVAVVMLRVLRPIGVDWTVQRQVRAIRRDLARLAGERAAEERTAFESRMFDRINALIARLGAEDVEHRTILLGSLAALRIGLNILALRRERARLSPPLAAAIGGVLTALARHLDDAAGAGPVLDALDRATAVVLAAEAEDPRDLETLLVALTGIRTSLTEHGDFFRLEDAPPAPLVTEASPC